MSSERRRYRRAYLPIAASLFTERAKVGDYIVRDLCAGGALFTHGPPVSPGTPVRAVLVGQGVDGLSIHCTVRRCESRVEGGSGVAVEFRGLPSRLEDRLQKLVLRALDQRGDRTVLLVHPKPLVLATLAADIVRLNQRVTLAVTPLDTIRWLCDLGTTVQTIFVDQSHDPSFGREVLELVREEFPTVRRVAVCEGASKHEIARTLADVEVNEVLDVPWTPSGLKASLGRSGGSNAPSTIPSMP